MARSLTDQAAAVIRSKVRNENESVTHDFKKMSSIRSQNEAVLALAKIAKDLKVNRIKHITPEMAKEYLKDKKDGFASQKSLDRDRRALSIALNINITRLKAISDQQLTSRAYSNSQIADISNSLSSRNSLAVEIAHNAGLRAHELLTLKRLDEGARSASRTWNDERFKGREGQVYLVTGKGGLTREVLINNELSGKLEARRLDTAITTVDRGVNYLQRYDIGGGNALSAAFTRASQRALSFSHGLHGVRHRYAQERIDELKMNFRLSHDEAREIVSQELGHFRGEITEVYLR